MYHTSRPHSARSCDERTRHSLTAKSITQAIRLSVNRYRATACDGPANRHQSGNQATDDGPCVDQMTSADLADDHRARCSSHERLLHDTVHVHAYWKAIVGNSHLIKGKTVLDVRCGLGVLSMFAIMAGAKHVYAIDDSAVIHQTERIIEQNGFGDKITVVRGKVADVALPVNQVRARKRRAAQVF